MYNKYRMYVYMYSLHVCTFCIRIRMYRVYAYVRICTVCVCVRACVCVQCVRTYVIYMYSVHISNCTK